MNYLIIVAGGNGKRMKSPINKIFLKIDGKPIIYWTLKAFEQSKVIDKIIISARKEDIKKIKLLIKKNNFKKIIGIVEANHSRQDSTFLVLKWLKTQLKNNDLIGVHNAVNPFVSELEIINVFEAAKKHGAALLAHPARDTVKITNGEGIVEKTPLRELCWYAQTPQVSIFSNLWGAFTKAQEDNFLGTDDTQLLEKIGIKAKIVPCSNFNFKITFQEDLIIAKKILKMLNKENV